MALLLLLRRLSLFGPIAGPFPVPDKTTSAAARSRRQGRPSGRRGTRLALDVGEPGRTLSIVGTGRDKPRARRATIVVLLVLTVGGDPAISRGAEAAPTAVMGREIDAAIAEASARFGLPTRLIRAVLWAESRGQAEAVSPKGAMGLMQLMPAAWREMRAELALGDDPFQVRDNVLAGTGYLRELYDRFGSPGYLAAYNAGSGRYQRHLDGVSPLPRETLNYVDDVARRASSLDAAIEPTKADWRGSGLFVEAPVEAAGKGSVFVSRNAEARR